MTSDQKMDFVVGTANAAICAVMTGLVAGFSDIGFSILAGAVTLVMLAGICYIVKDTWWVPRFELQAANAWYGFGFSKCDIFDYQRLYRPKYTLSLGFLTISVTN